MNGEHSGPQPPRNGTLHVSFDSKSVFLAHHLPVEIRDREHRLVQQLVGGQGAELAEGLYSVSAILESGARQTMLAHVRAESRTELTFGRADDQSTTPGRDPIAELHETRSVSRMVAREKPRSRLRLRDIAILPDGDHGGGPRRSPAIEIQVSPGLEGAQAGSGGARFDLRIASQGSTPPWIRVRTGNEDLLLALPLSLHAAASSCTVRVSRPRRTGSAAQIQVTLPAERRVVGALHAMVTTGKLGPGLALAKEASELLASKYSDPAGAAYGGLLLNRFGELRERTAWVENLAKDFPWLPDARILLAALLARSGDAEQRRRGLAALLDAVWIRPTVFSEALSLASTLLRRWPGGEREQERMEALGELAPLLARMDRTSTFTLVRPPRTEDRGWGGR